MNSEGPFQILFALLNFNFLDVLEKYPHFSTHTKVIDTCSLFVENDISFLPIISEKVKK